MGQHRLCSQTDEITYFFGLPNDCFIHIVSVPQLRRRLEEQ